MASPIKITHVSICRKTPVDICYNFTPLVPRCTQFITHSTVHMLSYKFRQLLLGSLSSWNGGRTPYWGLTSADNSHNT